MVRGCLGDPGDDAIRARKQGAQTQPILGVTGDIADPIAPAAGKGLKRCASVKVEQQASPGPEEIAQSRPGSGLDRLRLPLFLRWIEWPMPVDDLRGCRLGYMRGAVLAGCAILMAIPGVAAQQTTAPLAEAAASASEAYQGPFAFNEEEPVVAASPAAAVSFELPAGTAIRDYEASPTGNEVAVIVEEAGHRQRIAFWRFSGNAFARTIDVPPQTRLVSLTWHPHGRALFLLATGAAGSQILRLDVASTTFSPREVFTTRNSLRRLVVGPRPFQVSGDKDPDIRLYFGEKLPNGGYALRTVSETGKVPYTVVGPEPDAAYRGRNDEDVPKTTIAPFALPLQFHPAGNVLIWEDAQKCLHKIAYGADNWESSKPFGECGHTVTYTPNGIATVDWQPGRPGIRIHGLVDGTDTAALGEYTLDSVPSHMPDGRGVVAITADNGRSVLRYAPVSVPLANVTNAWMYLENAGDQQTFSHENGLFRPLQKNEQLYQLYDSESYQCGEPDARVPTRPYFVTTDLFFELYGAAFDGLFVILERAQAMPAFARFVSAADADLRAHHPGTRMAKAFAAARAVLEDHAETDAEAKLIVAARGRAQSLVLDDSLDFAQFRPRGHYTSDDQKRYFAAVRYLSALPLDKDDTALLRSLDAAVGQAALAWIAVYRPFTASSRLELVWGAPAASPIASHQGAKGTRLFPLSWGWDNEALDNVVDHPERPAAERIMSRDGGSRTLPSGLDFAAIGGDQLARAILERSGVLATFPNLASRLDATRKRFSAAAGASRTNLYDDWIAALATSWAEPSSGSAIAGPLWETKRLQTGLASWTTLRHATVLVNDKTAAECGEGGFESIVMRPPRGYVEPDPATFTAIAALFDATIAVVRASPAIDPQLRDGIIRRLDESRDNTRKYQVIAEKELRGEALTAGDYELIQYVGRAAEHNFLIFMSLANPKYALSNPDPMMKVADVADGPSSTLEAAVGRPLEWDQIVPYFGRSEIVKGSIYSYYELASDHPIDDAAWRDRVDRQARPDWVSRYMSNVELSCPARQP
jgi:hypothetical protein